MTLVAGPFRISREAFGPAAGLMNLFSAIF
jgi:hypothetical protein